MSTIEEKRKRIEQLEEEIDKKRKEIEQIDREIVTEISRNCDRDRKCGEHASLSRYPELYVNLLKGNYKLLK